MRTVDPKSEVRGRYRYRLVVGALPADRKPHGSDRRGLGLRDQARRLPVHLPTRRRLRAPVLGKAGLAAVIRP